MFSYGGGVLVTEPLQVIIRLRVGSSDVDHFA